MNDNAVSKFPSIQAAYTDEFGKVDPEVYEVAKNIWSSAESFALRLLHDSQKGLDLLLKAVVKVSCVRENTEIKNIPAYLYLTYKRLVLAELEKENGRQRLLSEHFVAENDIHKVEDDLNKKILINELKKRMDSWTCEVFELLSVGYSYKELVPRFGTAANVIRSKYSKKIAKLAREITSELDDIEKHI